MQSIEQRLAHLGLALPGPIQAPAGVVLPFRFVHIVGNRALVSGHGPQGADGSMAEPLGKLGRELTVEQGYVAARLTAMSILGSLRRALGDLDRNRDMLAMTRRAIALISATGLIVPSAFET
jgi:hypothetical protein